ncbi:hypothetical protein SDC9_109057 [bioreactor metagenome]|uniref:VanZ-like domain-containing protein n=1 Tax=bioreactor metagenome TaxID=1076179 RepID=A0A645BC01_9ZZZZ
MTIPLGILIPFIYKKNFLKTLCDVFYFSLIIEFFQLFSNGGLRSFDTTDLISNTLGGIIGFMIFLMFNPLAELLMRKFFKGPSDENTLSGKMTKKERIILMILGLQLLIRSLLVAYL